MSVITVYDRLITRINPRIISCVALLLVIAGILGLSIWAPRYNWDMVPYTIITVYDTRNSVADNHSLAWSLIEARVTEEDLDNLREGTLFRHQMSEDPDSLQAFLPMWEIKAGYISLLRALNRYFDPITAMQFISVTSAIIITFLLFLTVLGSNGWWTLLWIPIIGSLEIFRLAQYLTPDSLTTLVYLAGILCLMRKNVSAAATLFLLGLFIRPDNIFLNLGMVAIIATLSWHSAAFLVVGSMSIYFFFAHTTGHAGWWPHFYFTFIEKAYPPIDLDIGAIVLIYGKVLALNVAKLVYEGSIFMAVLVTTISLRYFNAGCEATSRTQMAIVLVTTAGLKFAVFPYADFRVFAPYFYGLGAVLMFIVSKAGEATGSMHAK